MAFSIAARPSGAASRQIAVTSCAPRSKRYSIADSSEPPVAFPAAYPGVLAVGAVDFKSEHPKFSQVGPELALVAPGVDVLSAMVLGAESFSKVGVDGQAFDSRSLAFSALGDYTGKLLTCGVGDSLAACGAEATCDEIAPVRTKRRESVHREGARNEPGNILSRVSESQLIFVTGVENRAGDRIRVNRLIRRQIDDAAPRVRVLERHGAGKTPERRLRE